MSKYKDKALILGCGPSLDVINKDLVDEFSKTHIIATIKQSYLRFGEYSDLHFFNCNNITPYTRNKAKFIYCSPSKSCWCPVDYFFEISEANKKLSGFQDLDEFFKSSNIGKFSGPGIMFEVVLPFIYNLGVTEIVTAGWDYYEPGKKIKVKHFYDESERRGFVNPAFNPYNGENEESISNSKVVNNYFLSKGVKLFCCESDNCFLDNSITRIKL
jgi:hypothetical protein